MPINVHPDPLPEGRRNDPRRRAEMSVLRHLATSHLDGTARYEWKADADSQEVDFAVWVENLGRFAIQVKGGQYAISNHDWHLVVPGAPMERKPSPLVQTWDGALSMHEVLEDVLGFYIFIIPVLVLPDMDHDPHMAALSAEKSVHLVWRGQDLSARLMEIAESAGVRRPPIKAHIENELYAIMYRERLWPAAPAHQEVRTPEAVGTPTDAGAVNLVINNYGPLIALCGTPDHLAGVMTSIMPVVPPSGEASQPAAPYAPPPSVPETVTDTGGAVPDPGR